MTLDLMVSWYSSCPQTRLMLLNSRSYAVLWLLLHDCLISCYIGCELKYQSYWLEGDKSPAKYEFAPHTCHRALCSIFLSSTLLTLAEEIINSWLVFSTSCFCLILLPFSWFLGFMYLSCPQDFECKSSCRIN